MYLVKTKTLLTKALRTVFDDSAPETDFQNLHISIEYPVDKQHYPSIWVDFDPSGSLRIAGIGHFEQTDSELATSPELYRWRFSGMATMTIAALTSLERDRLFDAVVRVLGFGDRSNNLGRFRTMIENNDLIAINIDFDEIEQRGFAASQGTPWGTDEMIYEATIAMEVIGEFTVDNTQALVALDNVEVSFWIDPNENDPTTGDGWIG